MKHDHNVPILAIDGGGTRCRIAYCDAHSCEVMEAGSANAMTDLKGTVASIMSALASLGAKTGLGDERMVALPTFVGLAGVVGQSTEAALRNALPFANVKITDDRAAALKGALGERNGVVAHSGTGSFFAAQHNGASRFAGGWGSVLGDEASACWVGRRALSIALQGLDGTSAMSGLCEALLEAYGGAPGVVEFARTATPAEFGAIAPQVTGMALEGDPVARSIVQSAADDVARMIRAMGWQPGEVVCLTGGIAPHFANYLPADLTKCLGKPEGSPLEGAITLAQQFAKEMHREHI